MCQSKTPSLKVVKQKTFAQRAVNEVYKLPEEREPGEFLGEINDRNQGFWMVDIYVNGHLMNFKLDTGARVTVLSDQKPWLMRYCLQPADTRLHGPGRTQLKVKGKLQATLQYRGRQIIEILYLLQNQEFSLLSRRARLDRQMIKKIEEVKQLQVNRRFQADYPKLFTGLRRLKTEYRITLKDNARPVFIFTPRKILHSNVYIKAMWE
ncbi:uncharacterized protein [Heterodontus francisci]|uniref:uncharacterized protein n=1 Tax=Heterodontus francisci TaxID=7792 RepID=UPI00355AF48B